jgi:hypothetical protein
LAGRPELSNELYEEALIIDKECNGSITVPVIQKMVKLDSFVKESLRHSDGISKHTLTLHTYYIIVVILKYHIFIFYSVALPHYMISKSYTFSNGFTIPEGKLIKIILYFNEVYLLLTFNPFNFFFFFVYTGRKIVMYAIDMLKAKEYFGDDAEEFKPFRFLNRNSPATKVDRSYIVFGGGKHACPGYLFL